MNDSIPQTYPCFQFKPWIPTLFKIGIWAGILFIHLTLYAAPFEREIFIDEAESTPPSQAQSEADTAFDLNKLLANLKQNLHQPAGFGFTMSMLYSNETRYNYLRFIAQPFFTISKLSVALNIGIGYTDQLLSDKNDNDPWNETRKIKQEEWLPFRYTLPGKIGWVRWGDPKEDRLTVFMGQLREVSLAQGTLVDKYSNMGLYPLIRRVGAQVKADFHYAGLHLFTGDIGVLDVMGMRAFVRPAKFFKTGLNYIDTVLNDLEIGFELVLDRQPHRVYGLQWDEDRVGTITRFTLNDSTLDLKHIEDYQETVMQYKEDEDGEKLDADGNIVTDDPAAWVEEGEITEQSNLAFIPERIWAWAIDAEMPVLKHPAVMVITPYFSWNVLFADTSISKTGSIGQSMHLGMNLRVIPKSLDLDVKLEFNLMRAPDITRLFNTRYDFYKGLRVDSLISMFISKLGEKPLYPGYYIELSRTFDLGKKRELRFYVTWLENIPTQDGPEMRIGFVAQDAIPRLTFIFFWDNYDIFVPQNFRELAIQDDFDTLVYGEFHFRITSIVELGFNYYKAFQYRMKNDASKYKLEKLENSSVFVRTHFTW